MKTALATLAALAATLLFTACDSTPVAADRLAPVESRTGTPAARTAGAGGTTAGGAAGTATPSGTPQSQVASVDLSRGAGGGASATGAGASALLAVPTQRVVYFDFDSFAIKDEYKPLLEGHARVLAGARGKRMVIEGHTDERGGREYNLALGQKRAETVLRSLVLLGARDEQLEAVSFGEERPAAAGADEAAWARNRRAELKDR